MLNKNILKQHTYKKQMATPNDTVTYDEVQLSEVQ